MFDFYCVSPDGITRQPESVRAARIGRLCVHRCLNYDEGWSVSHAAQGGCLFSTFPTRRRALVIAKALDRAGGALWNFASTDEARKVLPELTRIRNRVIREFGITEEER